MLRYLKTDSHTNKKSYLNLIDCLLGEQENMDPHIMFV